MPYVTYLNFLATAVRRDLDEMQPVIFRRQSKRAFPRFRVIDLCLPALTRISFLTTTTTTSMSCNTSGAAADTPPSTSHFKPRFLSLATRGAFASLERAVSQLPPSLASSSQELALSHHHQSTTTTTTTMSAPQDDDFAQPSAQTFSRLALTHTIYWSDVERALDFNYNYETTSTSGQANVSHLNGAKASSVRHGQQGQTSASAGAGATTIKKPPSGLVTGDFGIYLVSRVIGRFLSGYATQNGVGIGGFESEEEEVTCREWCDKLTWVAMHWKEVEAEKGASER